MTETKTIKVYNNSHNKLPQYQSKLASGLDIQAKGICEPNDLNTELAITGHGYNLEPNQRVLVTSGLHVSIPEGYEIQVRPRSGLALKHGITIVNSPGTIDADYRGDIGIILLNTSNETFKISMGMRIAQLVLCPISRIDWSNVSKLTDLDKTQRNVNGFNSTGL